MKELLSGNEAIARGALEAGIKAATAYPGTPSSEILETIARLKPPGVHAEWSVNEKVALEVAAGVSYGGARVICAMKHVGLNVAADPFMTLAYTGVRGGLVLAVADDPGMHSSQNEQDSRIYALGANIMALEPSDPAEAREMTIEAFELSEKLDIPIMLRSVTRISHTKGVVEEGEIPTNPPRARFRPDKGKFVMVPANARLRHLDLIDRQARIAEESETSRFNSVKKGRRDTGIIASGISYAYVKDHLPGYPILKIGVPVPAPLALVREFCEAHEEILVVEELEPVVERQVRENTCKPIHGKLDGTVQRHGEILPETYQRLGGMDIPDMKPAEVPPRPPNMCPGCPHRGLMYALKKVNRKGVMGDIGCYTLGLLPPMGMIDACLCMGAGVNLAAGLNQAGSPDHSISLLGDSTFVHSGTTGLINAVYNKARTTIIILDNGTTAMTGFQPHPGTGQLADSSEGVRIDLARICEACGAKVWVVDPYDTAGTVRGLRAAFRHKGVSVVISKRDCTLIGPRSRSTYVVTDACNGCLHCVANLGCPAMTPRTYTFERANVSPGRTPSGVTVNPASVLRCVEIDPLLCAGCGVCAGLCPRDAIRKI
jgi:indolepyruvate ferredoxin oxidoreductase alpha subunit